MSGFTPLSAAAAALALALAAPQFAAAQDHGKGHDKGRDRGAGPAREASPSHGRGAGHDARRDAGPPARARPARPESPGRHDDRRPVARPLRPEAARPQPARPQPARDAERDGRDRIVLRRAPDRGLVAGCPPGLARKDNGCLPPGQARRAWDAPRYVALWGPRDERWEDRYRDGYLYRVTSQGALLGYRPVLGGALSRGVVWPGQYEWEPVPAYYSDYYGLGGANQEYRYADGALYGVDPRNQAITRVAALLTGQDWSVGQPMPAGYDVYNVPYAYRGRYADSAQSLYRYNDGYMYEVDPTTRLVQAVIQLLT